MCKPCPTDRSPLLCVFCFSMLLSGSTFWGSSEFQVVGPRLCHLLLVFCCLRPAEVQCLLFHEAWCVCTVFRSCGFCTLYFYPFSSQLERRIWYWHRHFIGNVPKRFHFIFSPELHSEMLQDFSGKLRVPQGLLASRELSSWMSFSLQLEEIRIYYCSENLN